MKIIIAVSFIVLFLLGFIAGLVLSLILLNLLKRRPEVLESILERVEKSETMFKKADAYIVGLSEEEQSFKDSLKENEILK